MILRRYIADMTVTKTIMVLQSSTTGRILLKKRGEVWGFASEMNWDRDKAMLFEGLNELREMIDIGEDAEDLNLDYLGSPGGIQIFHCIVEQEPKPIDKQAGWFPLFDFPERFDTSNDRIFKHNLFIEKIISPDS